MKNKGKIVNSEVSDLQLIFEKTKEMKRQGNDIIELNVGDPESEPPKRVKQAAIQAIADNVNHYIPPGGSADLIETIAVRYRQKDCRVNTNEIVASGGSRIILDQVLKALIKKGDPILIPAPYYPSFVGITNACGGEPVIIDTEKNNFILSADMVKESISKLEKVGKTPKALILNSPSNPTGMEYPIKELEEIIRIVDSSGIRIISDECYQHFSQNHNFTMRKIYPPAIVIDSCSKTYAMTGYRVGWGVMPTTLVREVKARLGIHISSFSSISERAAVAALSGDGINDFTRERNILLSWLQEQKVSTVKLGKAGFYAFPNFFRQMKKLGLNGSFDLALFLLEKALVSVAPGIAFGDYDEYIRLSYCVKDDRLVEALERIEPYIS